MHCATAAYSSTEKTVGEEEGGEKLARRLDD